MSVRPNYLRTAIKAALDAGEAIMNVYEVGFEVEYKEDQSPLTAADKEANTIINKYLEPTGIPIISEENKQTEYAIRKHWPSYWIVDPVDGTKEFIKRNGEFTVNIALVVNGELELGVIYVPANRTIYFAEVSNNEAKKSKLESHNSSFEDIEHRSIRIEPKPSNSEPIQVVGSRSHMSDETLHFIQDIKNEGKHVEIVSKGSSLKFCLVAEGKADVYPRFAPTMEWDTAAGQAICEAVGVQVISEETGQPLRYNKENLLNPWFVVSKSN